MPRILLFATAAALAATSANAAPRQLAPSWSASSERAETAAPEKRAGLVEAISLALQFKLTPRAAAASAATADAEKGDAKACDQAKPVETAKAEEEGGDETKLAKQGPEPIYFAF